MRYPFIIYTDRLPAEFAGCANAFVIRIRPKYKDDEGIYRHELKHVKQWFGGMVMGAIVAVAFYQISDIAALTMLGYGLCQHSLLYLVSPDYRLEAEAEAYAKQAQYYQDDRRGLFAEFIATSYGLDITKNDALAAIYRSEHA